MERLYRIAVPPDTRNDVAAEAFPDVHRLPGWARGQEVAEWSFEEAQFPEIPAFRAWIAEHGLPIVREQGLRRYGRPDSATASLVMLTGGKLRAPAGVRAQVIAKLTCARCGRTIERVLERPAPHLAAPKRIRSGLFWDAGSDLYIASSAVREALDSAGLSTGLEVLPVTVEGHSAGAFVGLYASVDLGDPAAPYGASGTYCPTCERFFVAPSGPDDKRVFPGRPHYAFYDTFRRPATAADWMWSPRYGQHRLFVTARVRDWLTGAGAGLVGHGSRERKRLEFIPAGWYPDEADTAFLASAYRADPSPEDLS